MLALGFAGARPALAQQLDNNLWETNGDVNATCVSGSTLYIGGMFTYVGPHTGSGVPLDATSGTPVSGFPKVEGGSVNAVLPDGSGGWYIAGAFTSVGGVARKRLAHILAEGSVGAWDPSADGSVSALVVSGSTVYVGGDFASVGGKLRSRIAALDLTTGLASPWDPGADGTVSALAVSGSTVYAGGWFRNAGGQARSRIAALDAATGLATAWDPNADSTVCVLGVSGSAVYAGGSFKNVGGQARNFIAALDASTGLATAWNPAANGDVVALVAMGGVIYAGGSFNAIGGQSRLLVAALDPTTGLATAWTPAVTGFGHIRAVAVAGNAVYLGGDVGTDLSNRAIVCAAVDATTGQALAWRPMVNDTVFAMAASGNVVYAGGSFTSIGGVQRTYIAALDLTTGQVTAWNPILNFDYYPRVNAIVVSGNLVYIGGWFTMGTYNTPSYRRGLAALDASTGVPTNWSPKPSAMEASVYALALSGNTMYVGGDFWTMSGQTRYGLAAVDATTGAVLAWDPSADFPVYSLTVSGNTVYVGGWFKNIGGQARSGLAAVDATTGLVSAWNPSATLVNSEVGISAILVSGNTVYVGGSYTSIGGQARNGLAMVDATTGLATSWNPSLGGTNPYVHALVLSGTVIYAGGWFTSIGGQARSCIAAVDLATGQATPWTADAVPHYVGVVAMAGWGNELYVGGAYSSVCGQNRHNLAGLIGDAPVPVQISLVSAEAQPDRVRLTWYAADGRALVATVYRRTAASDWQAIASVSADGTGMLAYEDEQVSAGTRYGYRLGVLDAGQEVFLGETWVDVPRVAALALAGLRPNPAVRDLAVAFSLPDASPARLEVLDIAGRMVLERQVGTLGAGSHVVNLAEGRALPAGIYLIRLAQGGRSLTARGAIIR